MIAHLYVDLPIGRVYLESRDDRLTKLLFRSDPEGVEGSPFLEGVATQLADYFAGRRRTFDVPVAPEGTEFEREVWQALLEIPFGETRSYGQIAERIGRPTAVRAVGAANGKNPISIIVPCHRVVGADGSLTGYGGGLEIKKVLLDLERPQRSLFA